MTIGRIRHEKHPGISVSHDTSSLEEREGAIVDIAEALVRANYGLRLGKFELDFADGELRFQVVQITDGVAVGRAISASITKGLVAREDLFLQTKFTFQRSQDHRLPYDPKAPIPAQVEQSFASSLAHLSSQYLVIVTPRTYSMTKYGRPAVVEPASST